jgi:hypothetical protein
MRKAPAAMVALLFFTALFAATAVTTCLEIQMKGDKNLVTHHGDFPGRLDWVRDALSTAQPRSDISAVLSRRWRNQHATA